MKIIKKRALQSCNTFSSGIYNKCFYKMVSPNLNYVSLYDKYLNYYGLINTCDSYLAICIYNNCFLVSKKDIKDKIYVLSDSFIKQDEICLKVPKEYLDNIISLFYDSDNKKILISTKKHVYSITMDGYFIKIEFNCFKNNENKECVKNLNGCCQMIQKPKEICNKYITCIGIFCNKKYIGINKENSAYLLEISNNGNIINKYYIDDNITINSIINNNGFLNLLITKCGKYNYIYYLDYKCYCQSKNN